MSSAAASTTTTAPKGSILATLKALANKQQAPANAPVELQMDDPAIAGAKRDKNTAILGLDSSITENAALCAALNAAMKDAEAEYAVTQATIRDYGKKKRDKYNEAFKTDVTSVRIPFVKVVPVDPESSTPGFETKYVVVTCSHKYSVDGEVVKANKEAFGDSYSRLFVEKETTTLKPNAEEIVRAAFLEMGVGADEIDTIMATLVDKVTEVKASEAFETEAKKVSHELTKILEQSVTRSQPAVKIL